MAGPLEVTFFAVSLRIKEFTLCRVDSFYVVATISKQADVHFLQKKIAEFQKNRGFYDINLFNIF